MRRKKRPYHYKPTTLTLERFNRLLNSDQRIIDLSQYSNGGFWFRSLSTVLPIIDQTGCSFIDMKG
jgi:hypothetical protein